MDNLIPILAISLFFGTPFLCTVAFFIYKSHDRKQQLDVLRLQQSRDDASAQRMNAMQAELSQLRDTSTQFAMSLDHTLKRLEHRLEHMERRMNDVSESKSGSVQQFIGR